MFRLAFFFPFFSPLFELTPGVCCSTSKKTGELMRAIYKSALCCPVRAFITRITYYNLKALLQRFSSFRPWLSVSPVGLTIYINLRWVQMELLIVPTESLTWDGTGDGTETRSEGSVVCRYLRLVNSGFAPTSWPSLLRSPGPLVNHNGLHAPWFWLALHAAGCGEIKSCKKSRYFVSPVCRLPTWHPRELDQPTCQAAPAQVVLNALII